MKTITKEMETEFREAFDLFDKDGDGKLETALLGTVMRSVGQSPTEAKVKEICGLVDPQGTGHIEFSQFLTLMQEHWEEPMTEQEVINAFKVFDKDGTGLISAAELRHAMTKIGEKLSDEMADEMIKEADVNAEGMIDYVAYSKKLVA